MSYLCVCVCMCVCARACACVRMYVCVCVCACTYVHVCARATFFAGAFADSITLAARWGAFKFGAQLATSNAQEAGQGGVATPDGIIWRAG